MFLFVITYLYKRVLRTFVGVCGKTINPEILKKQFYTLLVNIHAAQTYTVYIKGTHTHMHRTYTHMHLYGGVRGKSDIIMVFSINVSKSIEINVSILFNLLQFQQRYYDLVNKHSALAIKSVKGFLGSVRFTVFMSFTPLSDCIYVACYKYETL